MIAWVYINKSFLFLCHTDLLRSAILWINGYPKGGNTANRLTSCGQIKLRFTWTQMCDFRDWPTKLNYSGYINTSHQLFTEYVNHSIHMYFSWARVSFCHLIKWAYVALNLICIYYWFTKQGQLFVLKRENSAHLGTHLYWSCESKPKIKVFQLSLWQRIFSSRFCLMYLRLFALNAIKLIDF